MKAPSGSNKPGESLRDISEKIIRKETAHWKKSIVVNGLGAIATAIVLTVLVITKFIHGAWIVVVLIPLLVALSARSIGIMLTSRRS